MTAAAELARFLARRGIRDERVLAAEAAGDALQPQLLEPGHFFTFAPPTSRSHLSNAATRAGVTTYVSAVTFGW